jgi:hypothetical protein
MYKNYIDRDKAYFYNHLINILRIVESFEPQKIGDCAQ